MDRLEEKVDMDIRKEVKLLTKDERDEEQVLETIRGLVQTLENREEALIEELKVLDQAIQQGDTSKEKQVAQDAIQKLDWFQNTLRNFEGIVSSVETYLSTSAANNEANFNPNNVLVDFEKTIKQTQKLEEELKTLLQAE